MLRPRRLSFLIVLITLAISLAGCAANSEDQKEADDEPVGSIGLELNWFGREFSRVSWTLKGTDNDNVYSGTLDISKANFFITAVIDNIVAGRYRLEMVAVSDDGAQTCRGHNPEVKVIAGATTKSGAVLLCSSPTDTGTVDINAFFDDCLGELESVTASPQAARVGEQIMLSAAVGVGFTSIQWSATAGSFDQQNSRETTYTCTEPGPQTISVTVRRQYEEDCPPETTELVVDCGPTGNENILSLAVFVPRSIQTCFIGDPCDVATQDCVGLRNDQNELVEAFTSDSFRAVATTSESRKTAKKEVCLTMVLSPEEETAALAGPQESLTNIQTWSHGDVILQPRAIAFDRVDIDESRYGIGVNIAPENLAALALPRLDFQPDFNLVIAPIRDPEQHLHHDLGACGLAYFHGIAGAGWNWVPKTSSSFFFECANEGVFTHELLHLFHFDYHEISLFPDIYPGMFPACGQGAADPHLWFPDTHQDTVDPDYQCCGLTNCGNADLLNSHIFGVHWDPTFHFIANQCDDGRQDFGETGVDVGGPCLQFDGAGSVVGRPLAPEREVTPVE